MKGFFSNLRTRGAECQMALQYEEDISPSLMLQERKGNPINSQEKKDFFLVSLLQKKGRLAKRNEKVGQIFGMVLRKKTFVRLDEDTKKCVSSKDGKLAFKGNLCQNTKMQCTLFQNGLKSLILRTKRVKLVFRYRTHF